MRNEGLGSPTIKLALGIVGTLVLGAIGSGIWEVLFRPGLSRIGEYLISISEKADHTVYQSAALDPTPIPSLILLLFIAQIPVLVMAWFITTGFFRPRLVKRPRRLDAHSQGDVSTDAGSSIRRALLSKIRKMAALGATVALLAALLGYFTLSISNSAVFVWRVFHQNLDISRPYLSQAEQDKIVSSFRRMQSKSDFESIKLRLNQVAGRNGLVLYWGESR